MPIDGGEASQVLAVCPRTHQIIYVQYVQFFVYQLHLNKVVKNLFH